MNPTFNVSDYKDPDIRVYYFNNVFEALKYKSIEIKRQEVTHARCAKKSFYCASENFLIETRLDFNE